ncbi:MAG TPA: histidine kinase dimerization/phospho-acceptor domain-containing protein, partial [Gaiellaceae bacterium]|nr:histidine kinase dimerization/phospho-acceptor domain-containing protein [Gaiellaceae bacterium]
MHELSTALNVVNSALFVVLAAVAVRRWLRKRDDAAGWLTLSFVALGLIVTAGRLIPAHPHGLVPGALLRLEIELLVLFPYLGYRFATAFVPPSRRLQRVVGLLTTGLSIWTFALPSIPANGEPRPTGFLVYIVAFLVHWTLLSVVVATRLWRAGRGQPSVARTRMRLLSFASAALTVAIIGSAVATNSDSPAAVIVQAIALLSAVAFLLGFEPPQIVRASWRAPEQQRLQEAIRGLMTLATTRAEVAQRVLGPVAALVGARAACIFDGDGNLLAQHAVPERTEDVEPVRVVEPGVILHVWTSPYAPFFGEDELRTLHTVAALTGVALDRVRLFEQEHQSRLALERANELMTNFVALAAHELRTPVTTVHGFVQTLNHLGDRLDETQKDELRVALEQQTARMA